jgi:NDP-sugar pyrophosphorylase family protein
MSPKNSALPEAIILCGGKGERLRPITDDIPKPLVKIHEKPILHYVIEHLKKYNITNIHIASGYKSSVIKKYFIDTHCDAEIAIYDSGDVDIIKRLQDILLAVNNDVVIMYGDTISDVDINKLINSHNKSAKEMSMTVWPLKIPYGLVEIDDNDIVRSFVEKPTLDKWINIGYFYINKSCRKTIYEFDSFETFLFESANAKSINAYKHKGLHITVNTLSELEDAKKSINKIIKI